MRVRATGWARTWTGLLVIVLLSFWPAFAACELECDLARDSSCCAAGLPAQKAMDAMPGMEQRSGLAATLMLPRASACVPAVCAPSPALVAERGPAFADAAAGSEVVLTDVLLRVADGKSCVASVRGSPPVRLASPVTLHILARV